MFPHSLLTFTHLQTSFTVDETADHLRAAPQVPAKNGNRI